MDGLLLPTACDCLRCRVTPFELPTHLLQARNKSVNLLLLLRDPELKVPFQLRDRSFLFLDRAVLLEEPVK